MEHVKNQDIDGTLTKLDRRCREVAEDFIETSIFMLTTEEKNWTMSAYRRKGNISSMKLEEGDEERLIFGSPIWTFSIFQRIFLGTKLTDTLLYEFDNDKRSWEEIECLNSSQEQESEFKARTTTCKINEMIVVAEEGKLKNEMKILSVCGFNDTPLITLFDSVMSFDTSSISHASRYTLTSVSGNRFILTGGYNFDSVDDSLYLLNFAYEGALNTNDKAVHWKKLASLMTARCDHVAFKLGNILYVAGGNTETTEYSWGYSTEIFNILENYWCDGP